MKNLEEKIMILCGIYLLVALLFIWDPPKPRYYTEEEENENVIYEEEKKIIVEDWNHVTITVYNPVFEQCDSTPLITADNSTIDTLKLKKDNLKWVAVSRDFIKNGILNYGDRVRINCKEDPSLSGVYTVHDTMHPRFLKHIDVLKHQEIRKTGKYHVEVEFLRD
jgi:3D (Asp-Asp-Asp) domain-containing protein